MVLDADAKGLSPPTRGNRLGSVQRRKSLRSIPAHAGEPASNPSRTSRVPVYPRPRGGTRHHHAQRASLRGLSPPTRGNLQPAEPRHNPGGSIPAHAGEPCPSPWSPRWPSVYPRPRGGTMQYSMKANNQEGLSPPTRGNRYPVGYEITPLGSIPAHAGEPRWRRGRRPAAKVYPRPRGGTGRVCPTPTATSGLSPPTRGNLRLSPRGVLRRGSIPAHAGEPHAAGPVGRVSPVYPRPRGGTSACSSAPSTASGLSPPTRGNLAILLPVVEILRSIPAHAGEPSAESRLPIPHGVYPRPRGGTPLAALLAFCVLGLSPPTRGNHLGTSDSRNSRRSIPAHAGEPTTPTPPGSALTVYPRPRGGTPSHPDAS